MGLVLIPGDVDLSNPKRPWELELRPEKGLEFRSQLWRTNGRSRARRIAPRRPPVPFPLVLRSGRASASSRFISYEAVVASCWRRPMVCCVSSSRSKRHPCLRSDQKKLFKKTGQPGHHASTAHCPGLFAGVRRLGREVVLVPEGG